MPEIGILGILCTVLLQCLIQNCTIPMVIDFPRYNMKCSGENVILRGIFDAVSGFPLHFMLYRGNLDFFVCLIIRAGHATLYEHCDKRQGHNVLRQLTHDKIRLKKCNLGVKMEFPYNNTIAVMGQVKQF